MLNDVPSDDPKLIWQSQPREAPAVNLILIREKARNLRTRARRQFIGTLTAPITVAMIYLCVSKAIRPGDQVVSPSFAFAWSVAGLYFLNRDRRWAGLPDDAGFHTSLQFCRRAIEQQCSYFRRDLVWLFGPMLLAVATFVIALALIAGPVIYLRGVPFLICFIGWVVAYLWNRIRQQSDLKRDLNNLADTERENS